MRFGSGFFRSIFNLTGNHRDIPVFGAFDLVFNGGLGMGRESN
jgi:hypothetical protein